MAKDFRQIFEIFQNNFVEFFGRFSLNSVAINFRTILKKLRRKFDFIFIKISGKTVGKIKLIFILLIFWWNFGRINLKQISEQCTSYRKCAKFAI